MSLETIGVIIAIAVIVLSLAGGCRWIVRHGQGGTLLDKDPRQPDRRFPL
ncbi:MAG: hypothetical protein WCT08_04940 [Patescibacteria group bacterium]|jgi:hypothetical protein